MCRKERNFPEGVVYEEVNSSCVVCFNCCQVVWDSVLIQRKVDGGCILSGSSDSEIGPLWHMWSPIHEPEMLLHRNLTSGTVYDYTTQNPFAGVQTGNSL